MKTYKETVDMCLALTLLFPIESLSLNKSPPTGVVPYIQLVIDTKYIRPLKLALNAAGVAADYREPLDRSLFLTFPMDSDYPFPHPGEFSEHPPRMNIYIREDIKSRIT